jgi:hypothetical protein
MKSNHSSIITLSLATALLAPAAASAQVIFSAAGATAASIQPTVDAFRSALGTLNANNGAAQTSGRREITGTACRTTRLIPLCFPAISSARRLTVPTAPAPAALRLRAPTG